MIGKISNKKSLAVAVAVFNRSIVGFNGNLCCLLFLSINLKLEGLLLVAGRPLLEEYSSQAII